MSAVEKEQPEAAKTRFAKDQLKAFVERIERLEEEKKTISDDIRDVYAESKGNGFDVKALRAVIRLRKQDDAPALTPREQEILHLIAAGKSLPEIAKELYLGLTTVKTHVQHLYGKLGVSDRAAAVAIAMRRGLIE